MCEEKGEAVVTHCASCDHFMCTRCKEIHGRMKTTKSHMVKPLTALLANLKAPYSEAIKVLRRIRNDLSQTSEDIKSALSSLDKDEEDQIKQVDRHIDKIQISLHNKIKSTYDNVKEKLTKKNKLNENELRNIQIKLNLFEEVMDKNDITTLKAMESEVTGILHGINQIKRINVDPKLNSPVTLKFEDLNSDSVVKVVVKQENELFWVKTSEEDPLSRLKMTGEQTMHSHTKPSLVKKFPPPRRQVSKPQYNSSIVRKLQKPSIPAPLTTDFSRLVRGSYAYGKKEQIKVCEPVQRMRMINGKLYMAAGKGGIQVNNTDLVIMKTIKNDKLKYVTSVDWCELTGDLIVACGGNDGQGLHQISLEGGYVGCLTPSGRFSDVCCQNNKVYALSNDECKVKVFGNIKQNTWNSIAAEEIKLRYSNADTFDKMVIIGDDVFVSSCINNCVDVYSASSSAYKRLLEIKGNSVELNAPVLCDVDAHGNAVVCNYWTHKVMTYSIRGWQEVTLPWVFGTHPACIALDEDATTIYVATHAPQTLIKYET